jgi:hypothetical protein
MKSTINYNHIQDKATKQAKAIEDILWYVGPKVFTVLQNYAMCAERYRQLSFVCSFAGVEGYPVAALWNETRQTLHDMSN